MKTLKLSDFFVNDTLVGLRRRCGPRLLCLFIGRVFPRFDWLTMDLDVYFCFTYSGPHSYKMRGVNFCVVVIRTRDSTKSLSPLLNTKRTEEGVICVKVLWHLWPSSETLVADTCHSSWLTCSRRWSGNRGNWLTQRVC